MLDVPYLLAAVGLATGITFALRALPFAVIEPLRSSRLAGELAARMPVGLMLILVIYLLRDVPTSTTPTASVTVVAALVVVGLHWWRSNALLCIFAGTAVYVVGLNPFRSLMDPQHIADDAVRPSSRTTRPPERSASRSVRWRPAR
jgi:branched chain amino acid efflux pump